MISRRSTLALAELIAHVFTHSYSSSVGMYRQTTRHLAVSNDKLYDYLFEHDFPAWFCNKAKALRGGVREPKDLIMKLHTGETQAIVTKEWSWKQREKLGQQVLRDLAEDVLNSWSKDSGAYSNENWVTKLRASLELDGYRYKDSRLLPPESDVLDAQEEAGVLDELYTSLALDKRDLFHHHLKDSEEHYLAGRWSDCISHSRIVLEAVLKEIAAAYSLRIKGTPLPERTYSRAIGVRDYLESAGLLEVKERETIQHVYGLLSNTGSHPYMADKDQARLLRHMALTLAQFVMLRFFGVVSKQRSSVTS